MITSTVYRNDHSYSGPISMLKKLNNGHVVLVFKEALRRGSVTHGDPTTRTSLIRSTDNGKTWHTQVTPDPAGGNGTAVNQFSDGTLLVNNFRWVFVPLSRKEELQHVGGYREIDQLGMATALGGIFTARSGDSGYTWEPPQKMETPGFESVSTAGRVLELADHTLLAPMNGKNSDDVSSRCWVMASTDGGFTWGMSGTLASMQGEVDFHELRMVVVSTGRILGLMRTAGNFYQCHSDDGGKTWSATRETPIWCGGSSPADLLLLADGRVLCTYGHRRPPYGVRACLSEDGGQTWDLRQEIVLRDDGLGWDLGYPSSEQVDDRTILTVYYWHEKDQIRHLVGTRWSLDL